MTKRLVVFNHKGGVSKTTSAYNLGWMLSKTHTVLLVDGDPQCNLTGLVLGDDFDRYYVDDATKTQNLKDGVSATYDGRPVPISAVTCVNKSRAPNLRLLAGNMNLSEYDAALTFAQTSNNAISTLQNLPGAFAQLLTLTEKKYKIDYTIIDLNPGLSAINQNLFLISNAFIIPTNPDPFSLMALDTLQRILPRWLQWKRSSIELFATSAYPMPEGTPKFIGSLVQRFNVRKGIAAKPYRENIDEINDKISTTVFAALQKAGMTLTPGQYGNVAKNGYCLGQISDFQGLLPKSNEAGVPIFEITDAEIRETGPVLETAKKNRDSFRDKFASMASEVSRLLDYA